MNAVLRNTLIYTGIYFVYCMLVMLVLVTVQIFWKPVIFMSCVILALLTLGHYKPELNILPTPSEMLTLLRTAIAS